MNALLHFCRHLLLGCALCLPPLASAADHAEAPTATADPSADIADVFFFREAGRLVGAITIGGTPAPNARVDGPAGRYDPDVLLSFFIDTNDDAKPEHEILIRFGRNAAGAPGVQFENLPGAGAAAFSGPVERVFTSPSGLRAFAGLTDDPFFFDAQGFTATNATFSPDKPRGGTLLIDSRRDSFGFRNLTSIVFEIDIASVQARPGIPLRAWGTSGRLIRSAP